MMTSRLNSTVWISLILLVLMQLLQAWAATPPLIITVVSIVPLLVFVPAMRRDQLRSYIWLCFVCLMYFIVMVLRVFTDPDNPVAWSALAAVTVLFCSSMMYVRSRGRELRLARESESEIVDD